MLEHDLGLIDCPSNGCCCRLRRLRVDRPHIWTMVVAAFDDDSLFLGLALCPGLVRLLLDLDRLGHGLEPVFHALFARVHVLSRAHDFCRAHGLCRFFPFQRSLFLFLSLVEQQTATRTCCLCQRCLSAYFA
jgi:hypothetical protein